MKVFYHSVLEHTELDRDSVYRTVPIKATLKLVRERNEATCDLIVNGSLIDPNTDTIECSTGTELIVRQHNEKYTYSVKPLIHTVPIEFARAYEEFFYELSERNTNEIESIQEGKVKMYAVEQSTEVHDFTELFEQIDAAFSSFKAICEKPKSHLKSINEVRPIETVKRIGYESIPYLAAHSEDWLARTASGLKPARLFSRVEDDEFQIYENRVTKTLIDLIISFLRKKEKELVDQREQVRGIMNSSVQTGSFGFDVSFQKAVSELMTADDKGEEYRSKSLELLDKLCQMAHALLRKYRTLRQSRLYRYIRKAKQATNPLNETNILLMDKHYNVVFNLWRSIHKEIAPSILEEDDQIDFKYICADYISFCKTLCGYTAHVLNFQIEEDGIYYRSEDNLEFAFSEDNGLLICELRDKTKREMTVPNNITIPITPGETALGFSYDGAKLYWENNISQNAIDSFCSLLKTRESRGKAQADEKERFRLLKQAIDRRQHEYAEAGVSRMLIWPAVVSVESDTRNLFSQQVSDKLLYIANQYNASSVVVALPKCEEGEQKVVSYAKSASERILFLPLTLFDINSFRRLQNVFLRMIVEFDMERCPCCGSNMRNRDNQLICDSCNQIILTRTICANPDCRREYKYLCYDVADDTIRKIQTIDPDNFYQSDSVFQYKDIVDMTIQSGKIRTVCPYCGHS